MVVWGILIPLENSRNSPGVLLLLVAWCIAECTRYIYYALNIYKMVPYFITWLRYTLFIALYPIGVSGELLTMFHALPHIKASRLWTLALPNPLNVSFYYNYLVVTVMLSYIHCEYRPRMLSVMMTLICVQSFHSSTFTCCVNARRCLPHHPIRPLASKSKTDWIPCKYWGNQATNNTYTFSAAFLRYNCLGYGLQVHIVLFIFVTNSALKK